MKSLQRYYFTKIFENELFKEELTKSSEELINESFNSSLLSKLAKKIFDVEEYSRQQYKKRVEEYNKNKDNYFSKPKPEDKKFSTLFGPITQEKGLRKIKVRCIKWNEIKDEDFQKYKGYDKKLAKYIREMFAKKHKAICIVVDEEKDDIKYVIKGFSEKDEKPIIYNFVEGNDYKSGVKTMSVTPPNRWKSRPLNVNEILETINDYDVYVLEITDNMIKEYTSLTDERYETQQGVINYDSESLKALASRNRKHYKKLAEELRAQRLAEDPQKLYNEIKQINAEVLDLYDTIMNNYEYIDRHYTLSTILNYVDSAFASFYNYIRFSRESKREKIDSWARDRQNDANNEINDVKRHIDKVKKEIEYIKKDL